LKAHIDVDHAVVRKRFKEDENFNARKTGNTISNQKKNSM